MGSPPVSHQTLSRCIRRFQGYYLSSGMGAAPVPLTIAAPETLFLPGDSINRSPWARREGSATAGSPSQSRCGCGDFPTTAPSWDFKRRIQLPGMAEEGTGLSRSPSEMSLRTSGRNNLITARSHQQCCSAAGEAVPPPPWERGGKMRIKGNGGVQPLFLQVNSFQKPSSDL